MSFDATRQVWALRRDKRLPGGSTLLVLLALADRADRVTGEVSASARHLATEVGVHYSVASRAVAQGCQQGAVQLVSPSRGTRAAVYRFPVVARPESNANGPVALSAARPTSNTSRLSSNASASPQQQLPVPVFNQTTRSTHGGRTKPAAAALTLILNSVGQALMRC